MIDKKPEIRIKVLRRVFDFVSINAVLFDPALHPIHEATKRALLFLKSSCTKVLHKKSERMMMYLPFSNVTPLPMPHHASRVLIEHVICATRDVLVLSQL
jgi:hypothetical protein